MDSSLPSSLPTSALAAEDGRAPDSMQSLGQYELLERLGAGGMGTVYRAIHSRLKRPAAVKLLRADRIEHRESLARFLGEMEAVGRLDHPNLIRAYDAGEVDGQHYLVMELVVGVDLRRLVTQLGPLRVSDACEVIAQAARGLFHAHENGLVHRDVKPSNVMITCEGTVKLLDLGIARLAAEDGAEPDYTLTDQILGSADYLSPEQGQDPRLADARSDIYSLGCSLYYLLAGRAPFADTKHSTLGRKLFAHATERPPDINRIRGDLPSGLVGLLRRMLAKRPGDRPADMSDVEQSLLAWSAGADLPSLVGRLPRMDDVMHAEPHGMETRMCRTKTLEGGFSTMATTAGAPRPRLRRWLGLTVGTVGLARVGLARVGMAIVGLVAAGLVAAVLVALGLGLPGALPEPGPAPLAATESVRMNPAAMVQRPPPLPGATGWTLETRGGRAATTHLTLSPDERLLAVGDTVGCVRILRVGSGDLVRVFVEPGPIRAVAWLPSGREVAVAAGTLRIWEVATGRLVWKAPLTEADEATSLDCAPDGTLVSGHRCGEIRLWPAGSRQSFRTFSGHASAVTALRLSVDGKLAASGDEGRVIRMWSMAEGGLLRQFEEAEPGPIRHLAWSPDAKRLASCGGGNHVTIWDEAEGFRPRKERAASQPVGGFGWSVDGEWFLAVSGGEQGMEFAVLWDGEVRRQIARPLMDPNAATAVGWSHEQGMAYCGLSNGELRTYVPGEEGTRLYRSAAATRSTATAWSPLGSQLLAGDFSGWCRVWDLAEGRQTLAIRTSRSPAWVVAWHPNAKRFAVGHTDGSLLVLDARSGKVLAKASCRGHVLDAAYSPCGSWLATGEEHGLCRIWDAETGKEWARFPLQNPSVASTVAWSPDGRYLAFAAWDGRIRLVDVELRELVHDWDSGHGAVWYMLWAPADATSPATLLTSGSYGGIARWTSAEGKLLARVEGSLRETGLQENQLGPARACCSSRSLRGISPDGAMTVHSSVGNLLAVQHMGSGETHLLLCPMSAGHWLAVNPQEGFYRADLSGLETLVGVVATNDGQENHTPASLEASYRWKSCSDNMGIQ